MGASRQPLRQAAGVLILALAVAPSTWADAQMAVAAVSAALTRYPYLTDSIQTSITVNWATDNSGSTGSLTWGPPGSCAANSVPASSHPITVGARAELQWVATIPVIPDTAYCYRILLGGADLLGADASPQFTSQASAGSTAPF